MQSHPPHKKKNTAHACENCRSRKSRCDGSRPACFACVNVYKTACIYASEVVSSDGSTLKKPTQAAQVVPVAVQSLGAIIDSLRREKSAEHRLVADLKKVRKQLVGIDPASYSNLDLSKSSLHPQSADIARNEANASDAGAGGRTNSQECILSLQSWDTRPWDKWFTHHLSHDFVRTLLSVYMEAHHPFNTLFSAGLFWDDFQAGRIRYCSSPLVYAILSVACCYYVTPRSSMEEGMQHSSVRSVSDNFFEEALQMLQVSTDALLTKIQAWAILSTRQASYGLETESFRLLKLARDAAFSGNLHLPGGETSSDLLEANRLTIWGIYNLEVFYGMVFAKPLHIDNTLIGLNKPLQIERRDSVMLEPETGKPATSSELHDQLRLQFVGYFSELSELLKTTAVAVCEHRGQVELADLKHAVARLEAWEASLLPLSSQDRSLSHVLILRMYLRQAIIRLFLDFSALNIDTSLICTSQANGILSLWRDLKTFAQTTARISMMAIWPLREAARVFVSNVPDPTALKSLEIILNGLDKLSSCHPVAQSISDMLRAQCSESGIVLPRMSIRLHHPAASSHCQGVIKQRAQSACPTLQETKYESPSLQVIYPIPTRAARPLSFMEEYATYYPSQQCTTSIEQQWSNPPPAGHIMSVLAGQQDMPQIPHSIVQSTETGMSLEHAPQFHMPAFFQEFNER
ncbi:hypothetical protein K461DRAFT_177853 [Myriangium duriaei CBS 260.36]|uniref:Zn(2)-C6 fungal-type domain-containing protein n=1 Tax=Myriangium duriaei CBS 260.36 TaxID=1168546 RepID=A0A9P4IY00_9PEZI|nr:hypothetical protein K461DRAFT_177853 [Myriangium duriaei CBS 260.36]